MKKLIPAMMLLALGLSSCAVKTVTRKELLTPSLATAMDHTELTDMKYYGSDAEYDYFTRGYTRYRVLKSEDCLPESARFTFNNWMGGKKYTDCLKESTVSKLQSILSGTYQAARLAAEELMHEFPGRTVHTVDSLGAGFGPGLLAIRAARLREEGKSAAEAGAILDAEVMHTLNFFTVDDLNFLKATGRVSGATAAIGTVLNIKPILWGDTTGHITAKSKVRGRKKSLEALAELYRAHLPEEGQVDMVFISHGDCLADAEALAQMLRAIHEPKALTVCPHEPFTGSHVGPGMLALFFQGKHR
jgi:DegV family protein with EDD domain